MEVVAARPSLLMTWTSPSHHLKVVKFVLKIMCRFGKASNHPTLIVFLTLHVPKVFEEMQDQDTVI
ncbi:hypothetical protein EJB05_28030 [Eragrostis curvula]|uniref:Uncharacterized protein n=1 Tax=Eragrostis curvula TaxID=38414 RepID=A0A5J9UQI4_9POAL|nr:hypothetical protein EJB05_28030 [Eragrostis curvula]